MFKESIKVLDHGYVRLVEAWGHGDAEFDNQDSADFVCGITEAARQSTQGSFRGWEQDKKLLRYLFNEDPQHATPFEFAGMILEIRAPIFVWREWRTHRTLSIADDSMPSDVAYNEASARYAELPRLYYVPSRERMERSMQNPNNKQGSTDGLDEYVAAISQDDIRNTQDMCFDAYKRMLDKGVSREVARDVLPVGTYSQARMTGYLRNWLAFSILRSHPKAQEEIQEYSRAVEKILSGTFPKTYELFSKKRGA